MEKCKYCGEEFENKGLLLAHYRDFKNGECALREKVLKETVKESMPDRDPAPIVKKEYDISVPADDMLDKTIEAQVTQLGRATAEKLKGFPKEKVLIPIDKLNKDDKYAIVGINGWNFQIERGKPVLLPEPVVVLLENGGYQPTRVR